MHSAVVGSDLPPHATPSVATSGTQTESVASRRPVSAYIVATGCPLPPDSNLNAPQPSAGIATWMRAPPSGDRRIDIEPPCALTTSSTIDRPRPLPPSSRERASSRRTKRCSTRSRSDSGMPGPSSSTVSTTPRPGRPARYRCDLPRAWRRSRRGCGTRAAMRRHRPAPWPRLLPTCPPLGRGRAKPTRLLEGQVVEVDRLTRERHVFVGPGEHQQVLDKALNPLLFGQHHIGELLGGHPVGMGEFDLGVLADDRDRRAQLMRCVGYEAALAVSRIFQSLQHSVHRGGEPTDLVVGFGLRYPPVQLRGRDLVHLPPDRVDGGQGATYREPGGEPDHATITGTPMINNRVSTVVVSSTST